MKNKKKIVIYSAFPILQIGNYFSRRAINPVTFQPKLNKDTLLPLKSGFPKSFLLKIEHELSLKSEVYVYSSFLNEADHTAIRQIANKYNAVMDFVYLETKMEKLFETYKNKNGILPFDKFCEVYIDSFSIPYKGIHRLMFDQID